MEGFIELTFAGEKILFSKHGFAVQKDSNCANVWNGSESWLVEETYEQIKAMLSGQEVTKEAEVKPDFVMLKSSISEDVSTIKIKDIKEYSICCDYCTVVEYVKEDGQIEAGHFNIPYEDLKEMITGCRLESKKPLTFNPKIVKLPVARLNVRDFLVDSIISIGKSTANSVDEAKECAVYYYSNNGEGHLKEASWNISLPKSEVEAIIKKALEE